MFIWTFLITKTQEITSCSYALKSWNTLYILDEYYCVQYFLSCVISFFKVVGHNVVGSYWGATFKFSSSNVLLWKRLFTSPEDSLLVLATRLRIYMCVYLFLTGRRVLCSEIWGSQGGWLWRSDFSEVFFFVFIQRPLIAVLPPCVFLPGTQALCADPYVTHLSFNSFVDCPGNSTREWPTSLSDFRQVTPCVDGYGSRFWGLFHLEDGGSRFLRHPVMPHNTVCVTSFSATNTHQSNFKTRIVSLILPEMFSFRMQ